MIFKEAIREIVCSLRTVSAAMVAGMVCLASPLSLNAAEPPHELLRELAESYDARITTAVGAVKLAREKVEHIKNQKVRTGGRKDAFERAKAEKEQALADAESRLQDAAARLAEIEKHPLVAADFLLKFGTRETFRPLKKGTIGTLSNFPAKVIQVLDEDRMLVVFGGAAIQHGPPGMPSATMLVSARTDGIADHTMLNLNDRLFWVTGTYRYTSVAGGSQTVYAVEEIDRQIVQKYLDKYAKRSVAE